MAERQGQGLVSRMTDDHASALTEAASAARMELVRYHSSARALRKGFSPEAVAAKVGILTAGSGDVGGPDQTRVGVGGGGLGGRVETHLWGPRLSPVLRPVAARA